MIRRLRCRLLRHDHTNKVVIYCVTRDGTQMWSHPMDRWSAEYVLATYIAPGAVFAGQEVRSCRIVVP